MGSIIAIIAIIFGASIPISAIISSTVLKIKKLNLENGGGISATDKKLLQNALEENKMLKSRVENLEMVTSDPDNLRINSISEEELQKQIDLLRKEVLKLSANTHKDAAQ
jgi:hypothetical protein